MNDQKFNRNYLSLISTIAIALATQIYKIFQSTNYFAIVILIIKSASDILLLILCIYCLGKKLTKFKSNFLFIMFFVNKIIIMFVLIFHYEFIYFSIYTADSNLIRKIVEYKNKFYITHGLILVIAMALNIFFIDSFNYEIKIVLCL